jgi:hypothetical protein
MSAEKIDLELLRGSSDTAIRLAEIIGPWEKLRPTKTFYLMTVQQFKDEVKPFTDALKKVADLKDQLQNAYSELEAAEPAVKKLMNGVVSAVKADREDGGEDGPLYSAMGYTPISKRASGLVRRRKQPAPTTGGSSTES